MNLTLHETSTGVDVPINIAGPTADVFGIVDALTERIKDEVGAGRWERDPRGPTESVAAFRAYSEGLQALRNGAFQDAIALFQKAVAADEGFALAHARLAEAYFTRNELPAAKEAIAKALPLLEDPSLSVVDRYQIQGTAARIEEDPARAVEAYGKLAELYPDDPDIRLSYASAVETLGELGRAATEYRRVLELSPDVGAAILGLGRSLLLGGRPEEATVLLRDALEAGRLDGDGETKGMAYSILGVALRDQGRFEEAIKVLQVSLEERKKAGDLRGVMVTLTNLAVAQRKLGRYPDSEQLLAEVLEIARESHNETMESFALLNLGNIYRETGDLDRALDNYRDSLAIELERKEHLELGHRLDAIAMVHFRRGQLADATVFLEQARVHLQSAGDQRELGMNQLVDGDISNAQGHHRDAIAAYMKGLSILRETGSQQSIAETHRALARVYAHQGRYDESLRAISRSVATYRELGMTQDSGLSLLELARIALDLDATEEGEAILESSEVQALETTPARDDLRLALGESARRRGALDEATHLFVSVITQARSNGEVPKLVRAQIGLGATQRARGSQREALDTLEAAYRTATRLRLRTLQARAALSLAETHLSIGDTELALVLAEEAKASAETFEELPLAWSAHLLLENIAASQGRHDEIAAHQSIARNLERTLLARLERPSVVDSTNETSVLSEASVVRRGLEAVLQRASQTGAHPPGQAPK